MQKPKMINFAFIVLFLGTLACSLSSVKQNTHSIKGTAQAIRSDVSGFVSSSGNLIQTAQALETDHPGILNTVKAIGTQGAPLLSTIQAISTDNPSLLETAKALINSEVPAGEIPSDIPILDLEHSTNFITSEKYIIYSTANDYSQVLDFYKGEMQVNGWQLMKDDSHVYAKAAQLKYIKDIRTATVNLSCNPLTNTTVIVINLSKH